MGAKHRISRRLHIIFWAMICSALVLHVIDAYIQGYSTSTGILQFAGEYAERRYAGTLQSNIYEKLALIASFAAAILGGPIFANSKGLVRKSLLLVVAISPAVLVMLLQSAKGLLFLAAAYFAGAWIVARVDMGNLRLPKIHASRVFIAILGVLVLVILSFAARFGWNWGIIRYYLASYSAGHLFAFSDWMTNRYFGESIYHGYEQPVLEGGFYTFMGLYHALGGTKQAPLGIYGEFFEIPGLLTTNIYTVFRGLISDFGILGSLIFAIIIGFASNFGFYRLLIKRTALATVGFVFMTGAIYQSYAASSLTWISVPTSFFVIYILLLIDKINFIKISKLRIISNGNHICYSRLQ